MPLRWVTSYCCWLTVRKCRPERRWTCIATRLVFVAMELLAEPRVNRFTRAGKTCALRPEHVSVGEATDASGSIDFDMSVTAYETNGDDSFIHGRVDEHDWVVRCHGMREVRIRFQAQPACPSCRCREFLKWRKSRSRILAFAIPAQRKIRSDGLESGYCTRRSACAAWSKWRRQNNPAEPVVRFVATDRGQIAVRWTGCFSISRARSKCRAGISVSGSLRIAHRGGKPGVSAQDQGCRCGRRLRIASTISASELAISELRGRQANTLSLFEKQLVAVGKALVRADVSLVLLDEPLTAVEPKIKWRLRQTLRKVQEDLGVTMIYVTHDQTEALTFADRVSVLTAGGILQTGTPAEIYQSPGHEFVGHFVGSPGMNFVPNSALNVSMGERLGFRPEWAVIDDSGPVRGVVTRTRVQGTRDSVPYGLVTLATEYGELSVRGAADMEVGTKTALRVHRYVAFASNKK